MIFRFKLSHEVLGEKEISEPQGWIEAKLTLERHADFGSLIEYFTGDFIFYGNDGEFDGGIDFIRQVERTYGVDAYLGIKIEIAPDNYEFDTVFQGQLDLSTIIEMEDNKAQVAIIRDDFWAKFINRYATEVNIQSQDDLDGDPADVIEHINMHLEPQKIFQQTIARFDSSYSNSLQGVGAGTEAYAQVDWPTHDVAEVEDEYSFPLGANTMKPVSKWIMKYPGIYRFQIVVDTADSAIFGYPSDKADLMIQFNDETPIAATATDSIAPDTSAVSRFVIDETVTFNSEAGSVKIYFDKDTGFGTNFTILFEGTIADLGGYQSLNNVRVTANTIFDATDSNSFLIHDVGGSISDRITGTKKSFYSEYLGSTDTHYRQYEQAGCGFPYALVQGLQLRGYNLAEKQYSLSMKKYWDGINPIQNLSLMYDEIDGKPVIRIEDKEHCFDDNETSIDIPFVKAERKYDPDQLHRTFKVGYKKWETDDSSSSGSSSGLDIPQTKHTYATQLKRTGKDVTMESEFIAGDLTIETTRRKTRTKTADYKYDNESFIIKINPNKQTISPDVSPDIDDYIPELNDVVSVTGLLNSETRYNKTLTPGRNILRWLKFISGSVYQYAGSVFKFTYGEGNYDMESILSDMCEPDPAELSERQDIVADPNPKYLPFEYEFKQVPLDYYDYLKIRNNRKKAIGISQTDTDFTMFFIKKLVYDVVQGEANITAWAKTFMDIVVLEGDFSKEPCSDSNILPDNCYRITEDGLYRITEDGNYRVLEDC